MTSVQFVGLQRVQISSLLYNHDIQNRLSESFQMAPDQGNGTRRDGDLLDCQVHLQNIWTQPEPA